jgi:hypothetical protein
MSRRSTLLLFLLILFTAVLSTTALAQDGDVTLNVIGFVVPLEEQGTPLDEAY